MIHLVWYSILEDEFYEYKLQLDFTHENKQIDILIGCTSKGMICFWNYELKHSEILLYTKGDFSFFIPMYDVAICKTFHTSININH